MVIAIMASKITPRPSTRLFEPSRSIPVSSVPAYSSGWSLPPMSHSGGINSSRARTLISRKKTDDLGGNVMSHICKKMRN